MLRKVLFWGSWVALLAYAVIYAVQIYQIQNIPDVSWAKWGLLGATCILIYAARNRDEVVNYHLPH